MTSQDLKVAYRASAKKRRTKLPERQLKMKLIKEGSGKICFILLTEMGLEVWPKKKFHLTGHGVNVSGSTDSKGEFKRAPFANGEYQLRVDDTSFTVPTLPAGAPPFPVHIPYYSIPELVWTGPPDEETFSKED
jgi:hypothetical protein